MTAPSVYIIAEAGVNHNGSLALAKELVDVASEAGADAVKFQTFKASQLVTAQASKAKYQLAVTEKSESQYDMLKKLELSEEIHRDLLAHCKSKSIQFLSTPFDVESLDFLMKLGMPQIKIPSGELLSAPLILKVAQTQKPIIVSTGMATMADIRAALSVIAFGYLQVNEPPSLVGFEQAFQDSKAQKLLQERVTILHCTTEYPAPLAEVNLRAMQSLQKSFGLRVGYSDHTQGIAVPIAATALGACVIEKHFTTDKNLPGPDHQASLNPQELQAMVAGIRAVELALGSPEKKPTPSELANQSVARKSLMAGCFVAKGEKFTVENLVYKRPGDGLSPLLYWDWLGQVASRDFQEGELICS